MLRGKKKKTVYKILSSHSAKADKSNEMSATEHIPIYSFKVSLSTYEYIYIITPLREMCSSSSSIKAKSVSEK